MARASSAMRASTDSLNFSGTVKTLPSPTSMEIVILDIVVANEDDQVNELYLNNGIGFFIDQTSWLPTTGISNAVISANLDGDDGPDLIFGDTGQIKILINDGTGKYFDESNNRLPAKFDTTQDLELGDIDADGDLDLLVGNENTNRILLNTGEGHFSRR